MKSILIPLMKFANYMILLTSFKWGNKPYVLHICHRFQEQGLGSSGMREMLKKSCS